MTDPRSSRPPPPLRRPICAFGQLWPTGERVCYGLQANAVHNEHCPAARRAARRRRVEGYVWQVLASAVLVAWGAVALVSIWSRTCGMGAPC